MTQDKDGANDPKHVQAGINAARAVFDYSTKRDVWVKAVFDFATEGSAYIHLEESSGIVYGPNRVRIEHIKEIAAPAPEAPAAPGEPVTFAEKMAALQAGTHVPEPPFAPGDDVAVQIATGSIGIIPAAPGEAGKSAAWIRRHDVLTAISDLYNRGGITNGAAYRVADAVKELSATQAPPQPPQSEPVMWQAEHTWGWTDHGTDEALARHVASDGGTGRVRALYAQPPQSADARVAELEAGGRTSSLEGCCSATRPCAHQKLDPCSLCAVCENVKFARAASAKAPRS